VNLNVISYHGTSQSCGCALRLIKPGGLAEIHVNKSMREIMGETVAPRTQADKTIYYLASATLKLAEKVCVVKGTGFRSMSDSPLQSRASVFRFQIYVTVLVIQHGRSGRIEPRTARWATLRLVANAPPEPVTDFQNLTDSFVTLS
jgi:hypothetical protein